MGLSTRILLVLSLALAAAPRPADACSCAPPPAADKGVKRSTTAFTGTITKATEDAKGHWQIEIAVDGVYRGTVPATVVLDTGDAGGDCSLGELGPVGSRWLVVSSSKTAPFEVFACSVTQQITPKVQKQLKKLGKPRKPT
jgi:hypothetical protein